MESKPQEQVLEARDEWMVRNFDFFAPSYSQGPTETDCQRKCKFLSEVLCCVERNMT